MELANIGILGWYRVWYENSNRYNNLELLIVYEFVLCWKHVLDYMYYTAEIEN